MIRLEFQKELILIKQMRQKSVIFVITGILWKESVSMNDVFAMAVII